MIEMSAAAVPALAQPGAILPAVPAPTNSDLAQIPDFSTILAGAALVAKMPELTTAPEPEPTPTPIVREPAPPELVAAAVKPSGKAGASGKETGKMLPPGKLPSIRNPAVAVKTPCLTGSDEAQDEQTPAQDLTTADPAFATTPAPPASEPALPVAMQQAAANAHEQVALNATPSATTEHAPARTTKVVAHQTNRMRSAAPAVQPITVATELTVLASLPMPITPVGRDSTIRPVTLATPTVATTFLQGAPAAIIDSEPQAQGNIVQPRSVDGLTIAIPVLTPSIMPNTAAILQADAVVAFSASPSTGEAQVAAAPVTAQSSSQALVTQMMAILPDRTAAASTARAPASGGDNAVQASPHTTSAPMTRQVLAASDAVEHKPALPTAPVEAPTPVLHPEPVAIVTGGDMRAAAIFAAPAANAQTTPTQDIAALVDRITEARAAAAPHTIRAALVHDDFGSVSLNFRAEASHIQVTLGSADPGFAPAVQAAAAANLAGNAGDDTQQRREAPPPQSQAQAQHQDAARSDASSQQQHQPRQDRAEAGERQPAHRIPGREPIKSGERAATLQQRSGIYA